MTKHVAMLVAALLLAVGCEAAGDQPDASPGPMDAAVDSSMRRVRPDAGVAATDLFAPCATPADCASGLSCLINFPLGLCSRPCTASDDECFCDSGWCVPRCRLGWSECRSDQACAPFAAEARCVPTCDLEAAGGVDTCPATLRCGENAHCVSSPSLGGGGRGASCSTPGECNSRLCVAGACVVPARQPGDDAYLAPGAFPRGGCPEGWVVVPTPTLANVIVSSAGDRAYCRSECVTHDDCADGLRCERHGLPDAPAHDSGGCVEDGCRLADADPCGGPAHRGGTCVAVSELFGVCTTAP